MPRLQLWNYQKKNNYKFLDFHIRQQFTVGGTAVLIHKYTGPQETGNDAPDFPGYEGPALRDKDDESQPNYTAEGGSNETDIQDLFYLENRDRKYDPHVYELRGHYNIQDNDFDLRQFGIFLTSDNLMITFHYNDMVERLGRPLMSGDVLELPHQRQEQLDQSLPNINKYYVVEDAARAAEGYDPHWWHHIWRVRVGPVNNQQEFYDILNREQENFYGEGTGETLEDIVSTLPRELSIMESVDEEADRQVPKRKFIHEHLYIVPNVDSCGNVIPRDNSKYPICIAYGDGKPPNGAELVGSGNRFPPDPEDGVWFLRTDYKPNVLFQRKDGAWFRREVDWRSEWSSANDVLKRFINWEEKVEYKNTGELIEGRQYLSRVLKPDL